MRRATPAECSASVRTAIILKDHKPSASQGEARLRGRERNNYSKTIISVAAWEHALVEIHFGRRAGRVTFTAIIYEVFKPVQRVQPL